QLSTAAAQQILSSYEGAAQVAASFPQAQAQQIVDAAAAAFTSGKSAAMAVGLLLSLLALALVMTMFPRREREEEYYAQVAAANDVESAPTN
ncbi:MAG: hypothetical protein ACKOT0_00950, partial [bacterium]